VWILGRQVIDTKDHGTAQSRLVDMFPLGAPGTDVAACETWNERLLAVATVGLANGQPGKEHPGRVHIFTVSTEGKLTLKRTLITDDGRLPDQIKWTKDCRAIIAAIEGEAVPMTPAIGTPYLGNTLALFAPLSVPLCVYRV